MFYPEEPSFQRALEYYKVFMKSHRYLILVPIHKRVCLFYLSWKRFIKQYLPNSVNTTFKRFFFCIKKYQNHI